MSQAHLIDQLDDIVYVSDVETYELLFFNESGKKAFGISEYHNKKCYEFLQGLSKPCPFCINALLSQDNFYVGEHINTQLNKHFILKNKLIHWQDKPARMGVAIDAMHPELMTALNKMDYFKKGIPAKSHDSYQQSCASFGERVLDGDICHVLGKAAFMQQAQVLLTQNVDTCYVMIMMDIDKFRVINDVYGMEQGDQALYYISSVLQNLLTPLDLFGHVYADTFYIMMHCQNDAEVESFIKHVTTSFSASPLQAMLTPYFGVYHVKQQDIPIETVCEMVGFAHKAAKKERFHHYLFYNDSLHQRVIEEKRMESEMEEALQSRQFVVYLQPKYNLKTQRVEGAEALVRWNHPVHGLIPPSRFIPLFEHNGFIMRLDEFVWEEVCKMLKRAIHNGYEPMPISVNVSRLHLFYSGLQKRILDILDKYDVPPRFIELELTESLFSENVFHISALVREIQQQGICVSMDDFGLGYSSLNMLAGVPVDTLKLDMGFINQNYADNRRSIILKCIISMAKELGMHLIAEGVETQEQADYLYKASCYLIQGYYYSPPLPLEQIEKLYIPEYR